MDEYTLLESLFGAKRAEGGTAHMETATMTGVAVEDSDGGQVRIIPDGHVAAAEGEDNTIIIPTSPNVEAGDNVLVSMTGGVSKSPMVIGVVASGDRIKADIDDFKEYAEVEYTHETEFDEVTGALSRSITATYSTTAPNLSPFYSHDLSDVYNATTNPDGYWSRAAANTELTGGGWAHIVMDNSGASGPMYRYASVHSSHIPIVAGTFVVEVKNFVKTGDGRFRMSRTAQALTFDAKDITENGTYYIPVRINDESAAVGLDARWFAAGGVSAEFDARLSYYEGTYEGGYKPYRPSDVDISQEYTAIHTFEESVDEINSTFADYYTKSEIDGDGTTTGLARRSELTQAVDGVTSEVEANYTTKTEFAANKSVRFKLLRDYWTDTQWATYEAVGYTASWSNYHIDSAGQHPATGYDISTLHVGDLIVVEGTSTDSKAPHSVLLKVNAVPSSTATTVSCTTVTFVTSKQLATRISQTESEISLQAKLIEESSNLLYDTDVSSLTKVNGPANRYFSDTGNTMITTSFASLSDPPKSGIKYAAQFVCTGTQTAKKGRGLRFYSNGSGNLIPLAAGQTYTATWWGRCTSGTAMTRVLYNNGTSGSTHNLTSTWKLYTETFTIETLASSVYVYFYCDFPANTAGTVQLCGFRLVAGDSAENVSAELSVQADKISMVVDDSTTSSSLVLTSQAMDYIGDHVEIKGTDGTTTVISGGQIQTGSLTIGAMSSSTQADILNSNIEVGGSNLLKHTTRPVKNSPSWNRDQTIIEGWSRWSPYITCTNTDSGIKGELTASSPSGFVVPLVADNAVVGGVEYTLSFDYRTNLTSLDLIYLLCASGGNKFVNAKSITTSETEWQHYEQTLTWASTKGQITRGLLIPYATGPNKWIEIRNKSMKLERGNKATDWSPAPEDEANARKAIYGTCSTAAGTAAKDVTCANFQLFTGARIVVKFSTASTVAAPTLNVNGTGAKAIWYNNAVASSGNPVLWGENATLNFVYDGTEWVLDEKAPNYTITCTTDAATRDKAASVAGALVVNGTTVGVSFSKANTYTSNSVRFNLSSTGAVAIYVNRTVTSTTNTFLWPANVSFTFVRNGAGWYLSDNGQRKYITQIDDNGVGIHAANNPTTNYIQLNASGMEVFKGGNSVAQFGDTARIGQASGIHTEVTSNEFHILDGTADAFSVKYETANGYTHANLKLANLYNGATAYDIMSIAGSGKNAIGFYRPPVIAGGSRSESDGFTSLTRNYTSYGFAIEQGHYTANACSVTIPIQFTTTTNIKTWPNQILAKMDTGTSWPAPPTYQVRVPVFLAKTDWSSTGIGYATLTPDGDISIVSGGFAWGVAFGSITYTRNLADWS